MHPGTLLTNLDLVLKFSTHVVKVSARLDRATVIDYLFESLSLTTRLSNSINISHYGQFAIGPDRNLGESKLGLRAPWLYSSTHGCTAVRRN